MLNYGDVNEVAEQTYYKLTLTADSTPTNWDSSTVTQLMNSGDDVIAATSTDAIVGTVNTGDNAWMVNTTGALWSTTVGDAHVMQRMMPDETAAGNVRVELGAAFTTYYAITDAYGASVADVAANVLMVDGNKATGTWAAASALTAAATAVVAASLF